MDYYPRLCSEIYLWWKNLHDSFDDMGPKMGLTAGEIAAAKARAASVLVSKWMPSMRRKAP
jgi:hypothetical protein